MGTRSHQAKRHHGAFGLSPDQKIQHHNNCVARINVIQGILKVDKSITKEERIRLKGQLKELIQ